MQPDWKITVIEGLAKRDPKSLDHRGINPCDFVEEHFGDRRYGRIDYELHELGHLMFPGPDLPIIRLALRASDYELSVLVGHIQNLLRMADKDGWVKNEADAIVFAAKFWKDLDSNFDATGYVRLCIYGQDHESYFDKPYVTDLARDAELGYQRSDYYWPKMQVLVNLLTPASSATLLTLP